MKHAVIILSIMPNWLKFIAVLFLFIHLSFVSIHVFAASEILEFDHDSTSFSLDFTHALVDCESCHVQAVFKGTPSHCSGCHSEGTRILARAPSLQHIRTTSECELCHKTGIWENVFLVDHLATSGSCFSCHNGVVAVGKDPGHVNSSNLCDDCHQTFFWAGAGFDHTNVTLRCSLCHNGSDAQGKIDGHISSSNFCEDCHQPSGWLPVTKFDHNSVIGACFSCHNGVIAETKNTDHIASGDECELCHSPLGWIPAITP